MKILIISTNGVTSFFKGWPERLQARGLAQRGHQVRAFTYLGDREFNRNPLEIIDGVEVRRFRRRDWWSGGLFQELAFGPRPDVVHIHHLSNQFAFGVALICKLRRIPVVMTPHGLFHDPYLVADRDRPFASPARYDEMILTPGQLVKALQKQFKPKRHLKNFLNHSPLLLMDRVIPLSRHGQEILLRLGVRPERITIIPNAVDETWAEEEPSELPAELRGQEGPLVLYLGQLKYRKGFDLLARAMPLILRECPQAHFVFTSHSPIHAAELLKIAEEGGARDRLILLNSVSEGEKAALFRLASRNGVYALPTRYEGFGIPLIEAMSLGCPVVTTNIPVIDELIEDGQNGLLFGLENVEELAAAIIRSLIDPELRQRLIEGGYATVKNYYTPVIIDKLEEVYRELTQLG